MTLTSVEFREELQGKLEDNVLLWTEGLCDALEKNYFDYHLRMITNNSTRYTEGELSEYAQSQLDAINNGTANLMKFKIVTGRKYHKIIQQDYDTFQDRNEYRDGSVHAFVDKKTGEVYKPASWKSPAKHVRYDMRIIKHREYLHNSQNTGWAGGYLYMR
tara:strand:+ start:1620 stop:2099 length:480 start_codon:yes stop_codon:yes gene_type:complete